MREHPDREALVLELHARPYEHLLPPERASHLAVLTGVDGADGDRAHVAALCTKFGAPTPPDGATFFRADLGPFRLRWERHTEFSTYTFHRREVFEHPFLHPVFDLVPKDWLDALPGHVVSAVHVAIECHETPELTPEELARLFSGHTFMGCDIAGGAGTAWSDFRLHDDRFSRILVRDRSMTRRQAGRHVQRLLEIDTYRLMALLAQDTAREAAPQLFGADRRLADIATRTAADPDGGSAADLLKELSALAAEIEDVAAATSHRFGAARAYHALVKERLGNLRPVRIEGLQTFSEFMSRHLTPAMRRATTVAERIENLSGRATRSATLLRARVEVALQEQNRDLLRSMNQRVRLQLRLQETVEGLSVVAISYYLAGLVRYALKAGKTQGLTLDVDVGTSLAIPVIAGLAWLGLRRMRRRLMKNDGPSA